MKLNDIKTIPNAGDETFIQASMPLSKNCRTFPYE